MAKETIYSSLESATPSIHNDALGHQRDVSGEQTNIESSKLDKEHVSDPVRNAWLRNSWTLELLSALIGCLLIVALGLILQHYHGKAPPHFGSAFGSAVGLNTVVSILSTAIKAFLLYSLAQSIGQLKWQWMYQKQHRLRDLDIFDQASRGLTGSFTLLWKLRWGTIASLGAILMIYAITIDAFSQQLILFASQSAPVNGLNSTTGIALSWTDTVQTGAAIQGSGQDELISADFLSPGMKGAIQTGIYAGNQTLNATSPFCSTGNCTLDPFLTLAVCGSVVDVSEHLTTSSVSTPGIYQDTLTVPKYSLPPDNYIIPGLRGGLWFMNISSAAIFSGIKAEQIKVDNSGSVAFHDVNDPIADFYVFAPSGGYTDGHPHIGAYEFVLEWCVHRYNVSVFEGTATTQVLETYRNFTSHGGPNSVIGGPLEGADADGFSIEGPTQAALQLYFPFLVGGNMSESPTGANLIASSDAIQALYDPFNYDNFHPRQPSNTLVNGIHGSGMIGLQHIVDNIATSMSNYIRQDRPTSAQGIVYHQTTVTLVRFQWITPLVVFAGLTLVLLAVTIAMQQTSGLRGEAWKSSTIPLLHAVEPSLQAELGGLLGLSGAMAQDKEVMVRLVRSGDDGGWRLVGGFDGGSAVLGGIQR